MARSALALERETRIVVSREIPDTQYEARSLRVYAITPAVFKGRVMNKVDQFVVEMGAHSDDPMASIPIGPIDRARALRDGLTELINEYERTKIYQD